MDTRIVKPGLSLLPADLTSKDELVEMRQATSKTYQLPNNQHKLVAGLSHVHYKDDPNNPDNQSDGQPNRWKDIDLTILDVNGKKVIKKAMYDLEIWTDRVGYTYTSKYSGRVDVELIKVNNGFVGNNFTIRQDGNKLFWDGVGQDLDLYVDAGIDKVEIFKVLKSGRAAKKLKWKITEDIGGRARFITKIVGKDSAKNALNIKTTIGTKTKKIGRTLNEYNSFEFDEEWTGEIGEILDPTTRQKTWTTNVVYPVVIDASTTASIDTNWDDGHSYTIFNGSSTTFSAWVSASAKCGQNSVGSTRHWRDLGLRFAGVSIPRDSSITSATLKVFVDSLTGNTQNIKWYGDNTGNAAAWSLSNLPKGINKTPVGGHAWTPVSTGTNSIDIASAVGAIVHDSGWVSQNAMRFGGLNPRTTYGSVSIDDKNSGTGKSATLVIVYDPPAVITTKILNMEWQNVLSNIQNLSIEWVQEQPTTNVVDQGKLPLAWKSNTSKKTGVLVGWHNKINQNNVLPIEFTKGLSLNNIIPIALSQNILQQSHFLPIDWLSKLSKNIKFPTEWAVGLSSSQEIPASLLADVILYERLGVGWPQAPGTIAVGNQFPLSVGWFSFVDTSLEHSVGWYGSVELSRSIPLEFSHKVSGDISVKIETLNSPDLVGIVPISWYAANQVFGLGEPIPISWLSDFALSDRIGVSYIKELAGFDVNFANIIIPIAFEGDLGVDQVIPVEFGGTTAIHTFNQLPIEWRLMAGVVSPNSTWVLNNRSKIWIVNSRNTIWVLPKRF